VTPTSTLRRRLVAAGTFAALVAAVPTAAFAAGSAASPSAGSSAGASSTPSTASASRVADLKARGDAAINARLTTLTSDAADVSNAQTKLDEGLADIASHYASDANVAQLKTKVDGDMQNLAALISTDQASLTALKSKIDNQDTTVAELVPDDQSIVTAFRIYLLVDPKIHLSVAADRESVIAELLSDVDQVQTQKVNALPPTNPGVADAKAALADEGPKLADAINRSGQVAGTVGALQPAGYPANKPTLQSNLTTLQQVRSELVQCRADAKRVQTDLHE
jgi:hypothetical protein